ncbi:MAG: hypothetical protein EBX39_13170, partial [Actinobacteria bacterium]|nr:hypothetical protein [Actinomycetota bacterium]
TNSGTIDGTNGILSSATIGSVTNSAGGLINAGYRGMVQTGGSVGQFTNNGSVTTGLVGVSFEGGATLGTFTNSGTIDVSGGTGVGLALTGTVSNLAGARIAGHGYGHGVAITDNVSLVTNAGEITAGLTALNIVGGTTTTINNSGSVSGANRGLETGLDVTIGTLTNSGTFSGAYSVVIANTGTVTNTATGLITATANDALYLQGGKTLTLLDNAGTISGPGTGFNGIDGSTVGSLMNSGTISGGYAVVVATSGTVTNAAGGLIDATGVDGVYVRAGASSLAGLVNAGAITAASRGVNINAGTTNSIDNSGSISGGYSGLESAPGVVIGTVVNSGTVSGGAYGAVLATTGTVTNASGALIKGTTNEGINLHGGYTLSLLDNAGTISAGNIGVYGVAGSTIATLTNSGTI